MPALTISQLFNPTVSGVGLNPNAPIQSETWLADLVNLAATLQLPTTSWQPGAPERTILAIMAVAFGMQDGLISQMAQGGFLDFAASGTVTTIALDGTAVTVPVTPDPSIPSQNPTGAPGWLDALGQSFYDVTRLQATQATGPLAIANTSVGTISYGAGLYHVANSFTGATYSNILALSVPPSIIGGTGGIITGVTVGASTTIATQSAHGLAVGNVVYVTGVVGVNNLNGQFAQVTTTPSATSFTIGVTTTGSWSSGGQVYLCTVANFIADAAGVASNAPVGSVTTAVTANVGILVENIVSWSAANYESNTQYAARCRLSLGNKSPNGPKLAYEYFALTAQQILAAEVPAIALTNGPIVQATSFANPQTGVVTTYVLSATPASVVLGQAVTPGVSQLGVSGATDTTPIVITSVSPHGLTGTVAVTISGVLGNTAANGTFSGTVTGASLIQLNNTVGNGSYTGGGSIEAGDLGQIDNLIQENVVPDGQTAITASALAFPINVVATVVVPSSYAGSYVASATTALLALLSTYPIGGNVPSGGSFGTVPFSAVEGALFDAGVLVVGAPSYVRSVSMTLNGGVIDLPYPSPQYVAILSAPTITVVGV